MDSVNCPLCGDDSKISGLPDDPVNSVVMIHCNKCGVFLIQDSLRRMFPEVEYLNKKHLLSGWTREKHERFNDGKEIEIPKITRDSIKSILMEPTIPRTIKEKTEKIIQYIFMKTNIYGVYISIPNKQDYPIAYAHSSDDFFLLMKQLQQEKMIEYKPVEQYTLTFKGYQYAEELEAGNIQSNTFFVAMWFDSQMDKAFEAIQQIEESTGFVADRVDKSNDYNGDINDEIIAKIRRSRFMVADFTGDRGGVYYEAGYAKGLGREVIFTCREDCFHEYVWVKGLVKDETDTEREGLYKHNNGPHFDIEHQSFILWKDEEDLKKKLMDRINATIL